MKEFLRNNFSAEADHEKSQNFAKTFFKFYDKKTMMGEISFLRLGMDKDEFIYLSTGQRHSLSKEDIINLCINMKLNFDESIEMMTSAGYEKLGEI